MKSDEIRERFLSFFEREGHTRVPSSSLIPANDPSLLFANAGMNQFKDVFLGRETRDYKTAASSQKCVRAGGKHNDLDNVGYTARHHTFFEMLGNFSFGDYFKERAIALAWRFLTQDLAIPQDKLYVTVYQEDDEAFAIWRDQIGIAPERIFRFGKKDNFWAMGDTGPCGPCSEIFYDYGDAVPGPADPYEGIASGSDRIIEVWNLVFMEFDRGEDGNLSPLPNPSIDTGMGLERISAVMQGVTNNYETDIFQDILKPVARELGIAYGADPKSDTGLRVVGDHLRASAFLIADGVVPSNEGRGYVLRRILRRAMRYGKQLGRHKPFLHELVPVVVAKMGAHYPELVAEKPQIELMIKVEEQQFGATLGKGMPIFVKYLEQVKQDRLDKVPGQIVHFMYGTHGFPVDLMDAMARDEGLSLDKEGFDALMADEAQTSQASGDFSVKKVPEVLLNDSKSFVTEQTCYAGLMGGGNIRRILVDDQPVTVLNEGDEGVLVLDSTSFYAESGGQVGDKGFIRTAGGVFEVAETTKVLDALVLHHGQVVEGRLEQGLRVQTEVLAPQRRDTMKNHTATHLLHQALRQVLGLHIRQAGSLVDPDKLRFDFSHFSPLSPQTITEIENLVNEKILANLPVETQVMNQQDARQSGAIAFFGDKYGEKVRVVGIGDFSKEFCGGTHVAYTGEIGCFKVVFERGLAAGVRRVVALTGPKAVARFQESEALLQAARDRFGIPRDGFIDQLQRLMDDRKELEKKIEKLKLEFAKGGSSKERVEDLGPFKVMVKSVTDIGGGQLRQLADELLDRLKGGVVLLASNVGDKVQLIVKSREKAVHAGNLVREMAAVVGGKGGGRPDMAMAGGKDVARIEEALAKGLERLQSGN